VAIDAALIGGAEPRQFPAVGHRDQLVMQARPGLPPVGEQLLRRRGGEFRGALVDEAGRIGGRGLQHRSETGFVGDGDQRDTVGPQQMRDLVRDGPARRGSGLGPPVGGQVGDERVQLVAFSA
jgi:hypothetical protein